MSSHIVIPKVQHVLSSRLFEFGTEASRDWRRLIERRRHERFHLAERVKLETSYSEMIGTIIEVSRSGSSLYISSGLVPASGTEMALTLRDNKYLWGQVCRTRGGIVAIEFLTPVDCIEDLLRIELRGMEIYTYSAWQ